jgi:protein TonB
MFEDATFESMGIIHTRSSRWMGVILFFEAALLLTMVLIPLLHPQALPPVFANLVEMTAPQTEPQPPTHPAARPSTQLTEMRNGILFAPPRIPTDIVYVDRIEPPVDSGIGAWAPNPAPAGNNPFGSRSTTSVVRPAVSGPIRISSITAESEIVLKTMPIYPPIARAARIEGTVRLAATISKTGSIENLRVTSGPPMLQQAALNAVSCWRYKPYLLDGQPVEVETTVDVIFTLNR